MRFTTDKDAFDNDHKEHIAYNQKIAKAKNELRSRLPPRMLRKKELWTSNKTAWQIMKIEMSQAWRQFDTKTRGMGLYLLCLIGIMVIVMIIPMIAGFVTEQINKTKYRSALESSCLNEQFYTWNFPACEDINVRPINPDLQQKGDSV